jgi:Zn-dependent metalloprotease
MVREPDGTFYIYEVHYGNEGEIVAWTGPELPSGDGVGELVRMLKSCVDASRRPLLHLSRDGERLLPDRDP